MKKNEITEVTVIVEVTEMKLPNSPKLPYICKVKRPNPTDMTGNWSNYNIVKTLIILLV